MLLVQVPPCWYGKFSRIQPLNASCSALGPLLPMSTKFGPPYRRRRVASVSQASAHAMSSAAAFG